MPAEPVRRVLLVEDDEEDYQFTRALFSELRGAEHVVSWVRDYRAAIDANRRSRYDVCLLDYRLGGSENGIDLVQDLIAEGHKMPVILLTGLDDPEVDEKAARAGAADFLVKGQITAAVLERTIRYAIQSHAALRQLQDSYRTSVSALAAALELRDDQTGGHAARVTRLAVLLTERIAPALAHDPELEYGFLLHDIGKIGVPDSVILKPGPLDPHELQLMRSHVRFGQQIIASIPHLVGLATEIVACHHERWDGTGYPNGLRGEAIPLAARIFSVVDTFDAITNDRPYQAARSAEYALREISAAAGAQFDPAISQAFIALIREQKGSEAVVELLPVAPFARQRAEDAFADPLLRQDRAAEAASLT